MRIVRLMAASALAAGLMVAAPMAQHASATFPGKNGLAVVSDDNYQIATINPNGTGENPLTLGFDFAEAPQGSANGKWIVFDASPGGGVDIFKIHPDGSGMEQLTYTGNNEWSPSFSPDGKHIVYAHDGSDSAIWVMTSDGQNQHKISDGPGEFPRYSPNGTKIAYGNNGDTDVHVMRANGTHDHALTNFGSNNYPDWTPDGKKIGFTSNASGTSQVWIMNADGTHDHQVTTSGAFHSPVFSPNGKKMIYASGSNVTISNIDGSNPQPLTTTSGCCMGWLPK